MAPRSAKGKKAADVKVAESEAPKRGRGKAKTVDGPEPEDDFEEIEKPAQMTEKKTKRGKKAANDANGDELVSKTEEIVPPAKKGRKKTAEEPAAEDKDDDPLEVESTPVEETEQNDDNLEANGHIEETQAPSGRGRRKQPKKEIEKPEPKTGRGRKPKQDTESDVIEKEVEEKPKSGRGRGRKAQPKAEEIDSDKSETLDEDIKPELVTKGRKKGLAKATKEKTPESDKESGELDEPAEEPKKKETKSRKNQSKKVQAKDDVDEDEAKEEEPTSKKRKVTKKEDKGKESKDEEMIEEDKEVSESKPKGRRGLKKTTDVTAESEEPQDTGEPTTKRRRKVAEEKAGTKKKQKNKSTTRYEDIDFSNTSKTSNGKDWNFKIASWNVDGIRSWMEKGGLDYIKYEKPDILCLQEVRCSQEKLPDDATNVPGYHAYWLGSDKGGYAGVGIYTTQLAMNVQYGLQNEEFDAEGRIITAEYEQFYLVCTYVPNAGRKLVTLPKRLRWNEEFRKHVKDLDKKKPVIICGDMNVSHNEIDLANPKANRKNAGFTDAERAGMTELLGDGFVDSFRHFNPDKTGAYTFWTYFMKSRERNVGWRLDYFIVSERLLPSLSDNVIRDKVYGSDHCPISLLLHLTSAVKPKE